MVPDVVRVGKQGNVYVKNCKGKLEFRVGTPGHSIYSTKKVAVSLVTRLHKSHKVTSTMGKCG